jgi:imidazolonepropionase-like amidohydrolase
MEMVTINPAQSIGLDIKIGKIRFGYCGDSIMFDKLIMITDLLMPNYTVFL